MSPATVRNILAELEELGYLQQPHTSAGRVPTAAAYHLFIGSMMEARAVPAKERRYIQENLKAGGAGELMGTASHLLSELSSQVGIVVTPAMGETVLKAVDFIPVSGRKVLCIVVSSTGFIDNKVIETEEEIPREELVRISNYLTENFGGQTLREIRQRRARLEQLARGGDELARTAEQRGGGAEEGRDDVPALRKSRRDRQPRSEHRLRHQRARERIEPFARLSPAFVSKPRHDHI